MSTRRFQMPKTPVIGRVDQQGRVTLDEGWFKYLAGIEDVSSRVSTYVEDTPTATQIRDAMVTSGQMKSS